MPVIDVPAGRELPPLMNAALTGTAKIVGYAYIPVSATDLSSFVSTLASGHPDAIVTALITDQNLWLITTSQQQGLAVPMIVFGGTLSAAIVTQDLGAALNDHLVLETRYAHTGPGYAQFADDFSKYANSSQPMTDNGIGSWLAVQIFAKVAGSAATMTHQSMSAGMAGLKDYGTGGLTATPLDFTATGKYLGGTVPRITQAYAWAYHVENGSLVQIVGSPVPEFKSGL